MQIYKNVVAIGTVGNQYHNKYKTYEQRFL